MMKACDLANRECVPCKGDVPPLKGAELTALYSQLHDDWAVLAEHQLRREFHFDAYAGAVDFTNLVAQIAKIQNHHPDIHLSYGKVVVEIWTHKVGGLTESDFIFAAKVDALGNT